MVPVECLTETVVNVKQIVRARVVLLRKNGTVLVAGEAEKSGKLLCDFLQTSEAASSPLALGDMVLVWLPDNDGERGVVLGRIGPSRAASKQEQTPDELVIEAKENLTFKCGDGSITLRKDGKILIKGKDLVSQARRMNRIKGGAVTIN